MKNKSILMVIALCAGLQSTVSLGNKKSEEYYGGATTITTPVKNGKQGEPKNIAGNYYEGAITPTEKEAKEYYGGAKTTTVPAK